MKEYINRELALKTKVPHYSANGVEIVEGEAIPVEYIENIPAADVVEVKHGRWILDDETGVPICSECHSGKPTKCVCSSVIQHTLSNYEIRYCYFCGAKMDGGVNDGKA